MWVTEFFIIENWFNHVCTWNCHSASICTATPFSIWLFLLFIKIYLWRLIYIYDIEEGFKLTVNTLGFVNLFRKHNKILIVIVGSLTGVVSIVMSLRVDRMYDQQLIWTEKLQDKDSPEYLQLEYESSNAVSTFLQTVIDL